MTAESRRDIATEAIFQAGGVITGYEPLVLPSNPHEIVVAVPSYDLVEFIESVRSGTESELTGLIPWVPEEVDNEINVH